MPDLGKFTEGPLSDAARRRHAALLPGLVDVEEAGRLVGHGEADLAVVVVEVRLADRSCAHDGRSCARRAPLEADRGPLLHILLETLRPQIVMLSVAQVHPQGASRSRR